jgi:5-methylcytosine-specific restriction endonuclease McrBC GTP-binding regulatory subunit McrB
VSWDKLEKKLNVDKTIKEILRIIKTPDKVYGHGLVSHKQLEKVNGRLTKIEDDLRSIKDKLGLLDNMDRLNEL